MSHPAYIYPAFSHMECELRGTRLLPSQTVTPLFMVPAGVGRVRGRRVCGGYAGCLWARERYAMSALRLFA